LGEEDGRPKPTSARNTGFNGPENAASARAIARYGIARRIAADQRDLLAVKDGTLYPALLKLEQEGHISSEWAPRTTPQSQVLQTGRAAAASNGIKKREWEQTTEILGASWHWKGIRMSGCAHCSSGWLVSSRKDRRERELAAEMRAISKCTSRTICARQ